MNNFQLILNTRNIFKIGLESRKILLFLEKQAKTEEKPKENLVKQAEDGSNSLFLAFITKYSKENQTISTSSSSSAIDKLFLYVKGLMSGPISLFKLMENSVKNWVFLSKKGVFTFRSFFLECLERGVFPRGRPLAKALVLGDTSSVSQDLYQSFEVIGILHLLSASSYNLSLFLSFFKPIFYVFKKIVSRKSMFFVYLSVILLYFSLVGEAVSMMRAVFMMILLYYAKFFLKKAFLSIYLLLIIAILLLFINPNYTSSLGFQLSFLASFGIYYLLPKLKSRSKYSNYIFDSILVTLAAQFFLLVIFVNSFAELNYIGILANLIISPLVEMLTIGFFVLVFTSFPSSDTSFSKFLLFFNRFLSFLLLKTMDILEIFLLFLEKIPYKMIEINDKKELWIAFFIIFYFLVFLSIGRRKNKNLSKEKYRIIL
jgi:competence protein ComEC